MTRINPFALFNESAAFWTCRTRKERRRLFDRIDFRPVDRFLRQFHIGFARADIRVEDVTGLTICQANLPKVIIN